MMSGDDSNHTAVEPVATQWQTVADVPALMGNEVNVWLLRTDEEVRSLVEMYLSQAEIDRTKAFRFRNHQTEFAASRGSLRFLLGQYIGQPAADVDILYAELGKPYLAERSQPDVHFNISHSGDHAVLVFCRTQELGIDIERHNKDSIDDGLLRQCLTAAERLIYERALPDEQTAFFFDTWARKEAYMKLVGDGLSIPPNELNLSPMQTNRETVESNNVCFSPVPAIDGFSSALATRKPPTEIRFYRLGSSLLR